MNKFKIINIYNEDGKTLDEIVTSFFINFMDDSFSEIKDIINFDGVL